MFTQYVQPQTFAAPVKMTRVLKAVLRPDTSTGSGCVRKP